MLKRILLSLSPLLLAGCSLVGERSGYEEPTYAVVEQIDEELEVRQYGPRLVADVAMPAAGGKDGGNSAFRVLFAYITGENQAKGKVAMTVPVEMSAQGEMPGQGETISMTVPVEQAGAGDATRMRFFFPSTYTLATAPVPLNQRITIFEVAGQTLIVRRYSGFNGDAAKGRETAALDEALAKSAWVSAGPPVFLSYDPPWTLPPFRRHEVAREVVRR